MINVTLSGLMQKGQNSMDQNKKDYDFNKILEENKKKQEKQKQIRNNINKRVINRDIKGITIDEEIII